MGTLYYGSAGREVEIGDRLLTHLKIVMLSKLRRGESFAFSWAADDDEAGGRRTIWLSSGVELEFAFSAGETPVNRAWIQALNATAERGELVAVPEPAAAGPGAPTTRTRI
jgi:hypothetical protein